VSRNTILTRVELASDDAILAERSTDRLTNLAYRAIGVDYYTISTHPKRYTLEKSREACGNRRTLLSNCART
jgi:hypothetical protein